MHRRRAGASIPTVHRSGEERLVLVAVVVGIVAGLAGCPVYHFNTLPASEPMPAPVAVAVAGPYVHRSGLTFPSEVGAFTRVAVARFDTAGLHVGVGYDREDGQCPVVATVFLSPAPRVTHIGGAREMVRSMEWGYLQDRFASATEELELHHPTARLASEGQVSPLAGEWLPGLEATYAIDANESSVRCYIFDHTWFLTLRVTHPETCAAEVGSERWRLVEELWRTR